MLKVVLDTNVYLSAAVFGGKPEDILALARKKQIQLFISEAIIEEITEVLKRKFQLDFMISPENPFRFDSYVI